MKKKTIMMCAAVAALLVSCGGKRGGAPNFGDNEYPVVTAGTQSASMQQSYPATIKGIQDVEIRPKASGFLTKVCVKEGQNVGAGQLLFVIDNETYQAQVRQAQAAVNTAQAQCNTAKLSYDNSQQLFKNNVIGEFELKSAQNTYESAKAQLAQAKAALASAKEALSFCYVKSPASGVVGTIPFKVGALVSGSSAQPLTTVSNINTMEVYFSVTEKDMLDMSKTAGSAHAAINGIPPVKLQLADGTIYNHEGKVVKMSGVIDASTGTVQMIAQFSNPERLLKSGGSGSIIIPRHNSSAIIIPQSVVSQVQDKKFVYVLGKDNKVKYTEITVNPQNDGNSYIVTSGLNVGDKYVTNGITKLSDGMEIKPITPEQYQNKIKEQAGAMTAGEIVKEMQK
jgi:membrane fusion protein (multidrug efflux system)